MATVFMAVLTHDRPDRRQESRGQVEGTPEEAQRRVMRCRGGSGHVIGNRVIDYMGGPKLFTEYHWQFEPDDTDAVFIPPWTPTGEPTPWLTKNNDLIGPPPPPPELVGNQFSLF